MRGYAIESVVALAVLWIIWNGIDFNEPDYFKEADYLEPGVIFVAVMVISVYIRLVVWYVRRSRRRQ